MDCFNTDCCPYVVMISYALCDIKGVVGTHDEGLLSRLQEYSKMTILETIAEKKMSDWLHFSCAYCCAPN